MKDKLTRREFLEKTTLTVAATACLASTDAETLAAQKSTLPKCKLGRTGVEVPALAFGGSRFLAVEREPSPILSSSRRLTVGLSRGRTNRKTHNTEAQRIHRVHRKLLILLCVLYVTFVPLC
ncbi:MAG: hypothetical protein H0W76_08760 [Pyrinomonadaceae bacterium]|nr:hypothetical protein [Pyrinomonadaceae bacterium]